MEPVVRPLDESGLDAPEMDVETLDVEAVHQAEERPDKDHSEA